MSQCLQPLQFPTPIIDLLEKYPGLLKTRHARVVKEVIAKHPQAIVTITAGVEVLMDKPEMDVDELRAVLVEPFEKKRVRTEPPEPRMITDKNGVSAFKVQIREREIVIKVEEGVDVDLASTRRVHCASLPGCLCRKRKPFKNKGLGLMKSSHRHFIQ
ncbi:hypothetical protein [Massilia phosphatilytica]